MRRSERIYGVVTWVASDATNGTAGSRYPRRASALDGIFMAECVKNIIASWGRQFPRGKRQQAYSECIGQCLRPPPTRYVCHSDKVFRKCDFIGCGIPETSSLRINRLLWCISRTVGFERRKERWCRGVRSILGVYFVKFSRVLWKLNVELVFFNNNVSIVNEFRGETVRTKAII